MSCFMRNYRKLNESDTALSKIVKISVGSIEGSLIENKITVLFHCICNQLKLKNIGKVWNGLGPIMHHLQRPIRLLIWAVLYRYYFKHIWQTLNTSNCADILTNNDPKYKISDIKLGAMTHLGIIKHYKHATNKSTSHNSVIYGQDIIGNHRLLFIKVASIMKWSPIPIPTLKYFSIRGYHHAVEGR